MPVPEISETADTAESSETVEIGEVAEIALSLCEEILAFLLRGPRWIERLVALVVRVGGFHPE